MIIVRQWRWRRKQKGWEMWVRNQQPGGGGEAERLYYDDAHDNRPVRRYRMLPIWGVGRGMGERKCEWRKEGCEMKWACWCNNNRGEERQSVIAMEASLRPRFVNKLYISSCCNNGRGASSCITRWCVYLYVWTQIKHATPKNICSYFDGTGGGAASAAAGQAFRDCINVTERDRANGNAVKVLIMVLDWGKKGLGCCKRMNWWLNSLVVNIQIGQLISYWRLILAISLMKIEF